MAALIFLDVNGAEKLPPPDELEETTLSVASSQTTSERLVEWLRQQIGA